MTQLSVTPSQNRLDDREAMKSLKSMTSLVYILQILALATAGITLIFALIINILKKPAVKDTWLDSHFNWQFITTSVVLTAGILGAVTWQYGISHFIFIFAALWLIYSVVRGWIRLIADQPVKKSTARIG